MPFIQGGAGSSSGSATNIKDVAWTSINAGHTGDDEFRTGNSVATFAATNASGAATWTDGGDVISVLASGQSSDSWSVLLKNITIASGGFIETAVRVATPSAAGFAGICLTDGTAAGSNAVFCCVNQGSGAPNLFMARHGTIGAASTAVTAANRMYGPWVHLRLTWAGTNSFTVSMSIDGVSWSQFGIANFAKTMTPTKMGLGVTSHGDGASTNGNADVLATFDYIRCSG